MADLTITQIAAFVATFGPWPAAFILFFFALDKRWIVMGWQYRELDERFDKLGGKVDAISAKIDTAMNLQSEWFDRALNQIQRAAELVRGNPTGRGS